VSSPCGPFQSVSHSSSGALSERHRHAAPYCGLSFSRNIPMSTARNVRSSSQSISSSPEVPVAGLCQQGMRFGQPLTGLG
jgi:hypothetical protein